MWCHCQESMKSDVYMETQVTVLLAQLHLKLINVLRKKGITKNGYDFFTCAILWKHLLPSMPKYLGPQRFSAWHAPGCAG